MSPVALAALDAWASRAPVLDPMGYEPAVDDRTAAEIEADADARATAYFAAAEIVRTRGNVRMP